MRFGPRGRLLAFGIVQTTLLAVITLGGRSVPEALRLASGLAFSSGLAALAWLLPPLLAGRPSRIDGLLALALAAAAAYAPAGLAVALQGHGIGNWRLLAPAAAVVAGAMVVLRARLSEPAAQAVARGGFAAFSVALLAALVTGPDWLATAALLLQVILVIRVIAKLGSTGVGRRADAAVVLANPFVSGFLLMVGAGVLAIARNEPIHLDPSPSVLVGALAISWLVPALLLEGHVDGHGM